jgi:hypothetical protein
VLFVTEKQPTSIAIGWREPVCGREFTRRWSPADCYANNGDHDSLLSALNRWYVSQFGSDAMCISIGNGGISSSA